MDIDDLLTTKGVTSLVRDESFSRGHVLLLDFDAGESPERVIDDSGDLPGVTAMLESSPGSFHLWNLTVRTKAETALAALATKSDPTHVAVGFRRGQWTLRVREKTPANASADYEGVRSEYRSAPEPVSAWVNPTDRPQSTPHLAVLLDGFDWSDAMSDPDRIRERALDRCGHWLGSGVRAETYLTMTDAAKADHGG